MLPKEDTQGIDTTPVHNLQPTNPVVVAPNHPTNEQQFNDMIKNPPPGTNIAVEETPNTYTPDKPIDNTIITPAEKKAIIKAYNDKKQAQASQHREDNAILDNMGLKDAYGDAFTEDGDIYTTSLRTGEKVKIGTTRRNESDIFDSVGFTESKTGVSIFDPSTGISGEGVFANGEWITASASKRNQVLVSGWHNSEYDDVAVYDAGFTPFKMNVPVTDNYGKLSEKPAWVLDYNTPIIYEPGGSGYELAVGPSGKKLDLWGGYDPKRHAFIVTTNKAYAPDVDTLGEIMIGKSEIDIGRDLTFYYGASRLEEFKGRAISEPTMEKPNSTDILVGGGSMDNPVTTGQKDWLGIVDYETMNWGGQSVKVDKLSKGVFDLANQINEGAGIVANQLPKGHIRNIGGGAYKTMVGIPTGLMMAGSAGMMLTEIAEQHPQAVLNVFVGTPQFMVEQKQKAYAENAEEAFTGDAINLALIGYGGFKMAGVKGITSSPKSMSEATISHIEFGPGKTANGLIKGGELPGMGETSASTPKVNFIKGSEIRGASRKVVTLEDGTKSYTSDVIIREPPKGAEISDINRVINENSAIVDATKADITIGQKNKALSDSLNIKAQMHEVTIKIDKSNTEWTAYNNEILAENARYESFKGDIAIGKHNKEVIDGLNHKAQLHEATIKLDKSNADWQTFNNEILAENTRYESLKGDIEVGKQNKVVIDRIDAKAKTYSSLINEDKGLKTWMDEEKSLVSNAILDAYLKKKGGDAMLVKPRQKLLYKTKTEMKIDTNVKPKLDVQNILKVKSPEVMPGLGSTYKFDNPKTGIIPYIDTNTKTGTDSGYFHGLIEGTITIPKIYSKIGVGTKPKPASIIKSKTDTGIISGVKTGQKTQLRTTMPLNLLGGGAYGWKKSNFHLEDKHKWRNAGVLSEYMGGLNLGLSAPKKHKSKRRGKK